MSQIPDTLEDAIEQAKQATQAALADGLTRLQVELVFPELKILPIAEQFIPAFANMGSELRVFFPDAGAAALARRDWGEQAYSVRGIGELKAQIQPEEKLFIFVEPSAVEVTQVEELCSQAAERPVVMLNPRLEDIGAVGIGWTGRQLRDRLLNTFESCYYLRPLEGAAILRCYPQPWQVWVQRETSYELVAEEPRRPVGEALEAILAQAAGQTEAGAPVAPPKQGFLANLQQFIRALSQ
ncbi:DUF1995 family protein [Microcoleus sp. FACHB-1515]|uniref:DUF1995 family protein n=2 Tax=Cyanophyceae TaxID=3028117 RepID=UPI001684E5A1|nr:DUF1995 family protein [Microcoleus sp. FACHB-1515]MBD2091210.1 DUF1995 family protein [Microcoleus sp. FACHB-1515]